MRVIEAKELVLDLMLADLTRSAVPTYADPVSPDPRDIGKFVLDGKPARAIHQYDGWFVPISLGWFAGGFEMPQVHGFSFHWYVFAIPRRNRLRRDHYFICDFLQMRDWVLDFGAPMGRDHRDHSLWRADIRVFPELPDNESTGYFRWGDEPTHMTARPNRVIELDNVATVSELAAKGCLVGTFGPGGESAAHRRLKLYVASHPTEFGLSTSAQSSVEHLFATGDRVDVMFQNHFPERTVVEVEVEGEQNVVVGIQQAVKYRSLAEVEVGYPLLSPNVRSLVVAYDTNYPRALDLAGRYDVELASVDRAAVIPAAV